MIKSKNAIKMLLGQTEVKHKQTIKSEDAPVHNAVAIIAEYIITCTKYALEYPNPLLEQEPQ